MCDNDSSETQGCYGVNRIVMPVPIEQQVADQLAAEEEGTE